MNNEGQCVTTGSAAGRTERGLHRSSFIHHRSKWRGFTFVELLAAMVFMAVLIPAAVKALMIANRAGVVADHKRVAVQLADKLLNETIVTGDWRHGDQKGNFTEGWPEYRWAVHAEAWEKDAMQLVSAEVFFDVQGNEYSVRLSTLQQETEQ